jgi:hypothetical protein
MPIPFNQVGTPNPMKNQGASTSPSASGDPRLHRCSVGDFLGVAGPMGIGMSIVSMQETREFSADLGANIIANVLYLFYYLSAFALVNQSLFVAPPTAG